MTLLANEKQLQQTFKSVNRFMLLLWRLGLGPWVNLLPSIGGRTMVITHVGRKTGRQRRTPLNYAIIEDEIYCTAGFGSASDWYRNVLAHPQIEVWLPDGWWTARAEEVADIDSRLPILRQVLIASGLAAAIAGIDPYNMADEELDQVTSEYRLIRIRRMSPCTGRGGPGDLAWVWPLATMILLPLALARKKR